MENEVAVYKSKDVTFEWKSPKDVIGGDAVFYEDGTTAFQQGELGNCWLLTAIESVRQQKNSNFFRDVVENGGLNFRFWQKGQFGRTVTLTNDEVPTRDGSFVFTRNVGGSEYWGILLEKAYAKWVDSYEGLEGGFWTDAIQSFTGGVVERIKLSDNAPENLFSIMFRAYEGGSSLCCIKKKHEDDNVPEKYHSCCINVVKIEEDTCIITVLDSYTQESSEWQYVNFKEEFHRLDMCHQNLDYLSSLCNNDIGDKEWDSTLITLQFKGMCDEYTISLDESCTFVLELVQKIKPDEGEKLSTIKPWDALVSLQLEVGDYIDISKFPQQTHCITREAGSHDIKISAENEEHCEIFMRIFSKKDYTIQRKD